MTAVEGIEAVVSANANMPPDTTIPVQSFSERGVSFADMFSDGIAQLDNHLTRANELSNEFVANPQNVAIHEVIIALEHARLSVELAVQVRDRMIESYREVMNMPL